MLEARGSRPVFPAIDILRGLAASAVLVFHVIVLGHWESFPTEGPLRLLRNGWVGVDLFFVISGFVIALSALNGQARHGPAFRWAFMRRRLARIVPLYLVSGAVFLFVAKPELLDAPWPLLAGRVASFLLFVQNLRPDWHGAINGPSWSVALEMQFYLLMVSIAPWLVRARAWPAVLGVFVAAGAYRWATTLALPPGQSVISEQFVYLSQLPGVIDVFALGMLLALAVHRGHGRLARMLQPGWLHCMGWAALAAALLGWADHLFGLYGYWDRRAMLVAWRPLLSLGLCALVACAMTLPIGGARWLAPLRYTGTISYGLYLWHFPILVAMTAADQAPSGPVLLAQVAAATALIAVLSWHLLEKPWLQRANRRAATAPAHNNETSHHG